MCLSRHETVAPKPPRSRASWCMEGSPGNLQILAFSELCIAPVGLRSKQQPKKSGPSTSTPDLVGPRHSESESYLLAHAYNINLNDKGRNIAYLSLPHLSERMILQPAVKMSVSYAAVYNSSTSIGHDLTWWEPQTQTAPPSAQVWQNLIPKKINLYINKEIFDSRHSFGGPSPYSRPTP